MAKQKEGEGNTRLPVTVRSIRQRIDRKLPKGQQLRSANRSARWVEEIGAFFLVDKAKGTVIERDVDLAELAKRLGCMEDYERIVDD